jgi:hypothetical protein
MLALSHSRILVFPYFGTPFDAFGNSASLYSAPKENLHIEGEVRNSIFSMALKLPFERSRYKKRTIFHIADA